MKIAIDTETHLFRQGLMAPPIVCLTWATDSPRRFVGTDSLPETQDMWWGESTDNYVSRGIMLREVALPFIERVLADETATIIGQNLPYDFGCIMERWPHLAAPIFQAYVDGRVQDTKIRERLIEIARGYPFHDLSLAGIAKRRLGQVMDKDTWRLRYAELDGVPLDQWPQGAIDYAIGDAVTTLQVYEAQAADPIVLAYPDFEEEANRQAGFMLPFGLMGAWGLRTDRDRVQALADSIAKKLPPLEQELIDRGLMRRKKDGKASKNMKAIRELVTAAYAKHGMHPPMTEPSATHPEGQVSTSAQTLEDATDDPIVAVMVEQASLVKTSKTYVSKLWGGIDHPIHPRWNSLGADSGRTSCSKPNEQNPPREGGVRECHVARPGWVYISADYDSQETRTLAQVQLDLLGSSKLAERYQADPDYDPHIAFACSTLGIPYTEGLERKAAGDPEIKDLRQRAKAANFGYPGGLGARTFVGYARGYGLTLTLEQSEELKERWFDEQPEMRDYFRVINHMAGGGGGTITQLRSGRIRGGIGFTQAANSFFQGLAADATKTAAFMVSRACYADKASALFGCRLVLMLHDELIAEAPISYAHEAAQELARLMVQAQEMWTPAIPARATAAMMRHWTKDAEPLYVNGRLVPFDDPTYGVEA